MEPSLECSAESTPTSKRAQGAWTSAQRCRCARTRGAPGSHLGGVERRIRLGAPAVCPLHELPSRGRSHPAFGAPEPELEAQRARARVPGVCSMPSGAARGPISPLDLFEARVVESVQAERPDPHVPARPALARICSEGGRERMLLEPVVAPARRGTPALVLLEGPAGRARRAWPGPSPAARAVGMEVHARSAFEGERTPPLWLWAELVRSLARVLRELQSHHVGAGGLEPPRLESASACVRAASTRDPSTCGPSCAPIWIGRRRRGWTVSWRPRSRRAGSRTPGPSWMP